MRHPREPHPWLALVALCACFFMIMLDSTIVTVAIPSLLSGLSASLNQIIWVNSVYLLTNTVPLLLTGRLGDRFGPKWVLLAGLAVFTVASVWAGAAGSAGALIAARALQGLGAAAMTPQTLAFITRLFPPQRRTVPIAVWGAVTGIATITGPLVGGLLIARASWRWIFFANVPVAVFGAVLAVLFLPNWRPAQRDRFDLVGAALASGGLLALVFGLQNGQHYHWGRVVGPVSVLHLIGLGVVLLAAFGYWQRAGRAEPLLPPRLFADVSFSSANVVNACLGFATTAMFLPLVIYAQTVLGLSALRSALLTAPMAVAAGLAAFAAGRWVNRYGPRVFVLVGLALLAIGTATLAVQLDPGVHPLMLEPALAVAGFGIGCTYSPLTSAATAALPPDLVGAGSGVFNTSRQVGGVLGSAGTGLLLQVGVAFAVPDAAREYAKKLPEQYRDEYVTAVTKAANTASEFTGAGPALPSDISPGVADFVRRIASDTFHLGFTNAAKATLVLPVVVLIIGMLAAGAISGVPRQENVGHQV